jgi:hypothetical protein
MLITFFRRVMEDDLDGAHIFGFIAKTQRCGIFSVQPNLEAE